MQATTTLIQQTEAASPQSFGIDMLLSVDALMKLHGGQMKAAAVVSSAIDQIALAAEQAASCLSRGAKLAYIGAGSSGLLAITDGLELPGTFGIDPQQIKLILAGGLDSNMVLDCASEDDVDVAASHIANAEITSDDCAILVSASGTTPFTLGALCELTRIGTTTIAMANNQDAPLLSQADIAIHLATPPEVLAGSTRMGAGTAQKIALNMFSTLLGIHLGHVYDGLMINVVADNEKLRQRAIGIVEQIADCSTQEAKAFVEQSGSNVKLAALLAKGAGSLEDAKSMLTEQDGKLRNCFNALAECQAKPSARRAQPKGE